MTVAGIDVDGMTHAELVAEIKAQCKRRRLPCYDTQQIAWSGDSAGWVDLVILGRGAALFVEVKKEDSRVTRTQSDTHNELAAAGLWCRVWRPSALAAGIIGQELDELAAEQKARDRLDPDRSSDGGFRYPVQHHGGPRPRDGAGQFVVSRCARCGRVAGAPSAPCPDCPAT